MSELDDNDTDMRKSMNHAARLIPGDLTVGRSDDGQYLLIYAGQTLLAIYGAMGADPEVVEFADGQRFAVDDLLDMAAG